MLFKVTCLETKSHFTCMKNKAHCSKIKIIILYPLKVFSFSITLGFEEIHF
jgi:hypothetical protein